MPSTPTPPLPQPPPPTPTPPPMPTPPPTPSLPPMPTPPPKPTPPPTPTPPPDADRTAYAMTPTTQPCFRPLWELQIYLCWTSLLIFRFFDLYQAVGLNLSFCISHFHNFFSYFSNKEKKTSKSCTHH
ncbi:hypothetical protein KSP39_PZI006512 [Platanthera zijinensis]|uniref:Uncharacterized protein n=1 Tax=Platanthera zijinensis TaxID=2320716 RepID=A0AAP0BRC5_9ASPA